MLHYFLVMGLGALVRIGCRRMRIGFTGTQNGMTSLQKEILNYFLSKCKGEFHHGDCIGADAEAHDIAEKYLEPVIHPPIIQSKRAFKKAKRIATPLPYLVRNKIIVSETDELIAAPKEFEEQMRSGTWSTIRHAKKLKKRVAIIYPNGSWIVNANP